MGKIEELIAKYQSIEDNYEPNLNLDYYERGVEAGEANISWRVVEDLQQLKSSLPTQQDKIVVPELPRHITDYLKWCERNNKPLLEVFGGARFYNTDYAFWTEEEE